MNSRERFLAVLRGETPDRPPLANVAALTPVELQERTGCRMPEAHLDPEKLVGLCAANHEVLGFDAVSFVINFFNEPAALGVEIDWGSPTALPMYGSHPWAKPGDVIIPDDLLDRDPIRSNIQALRIAKARYGDSVAVLSKVMGPLSMTQVMHGVEQTMLGMYDDQDSIRRFLDCSVDILVRTANAQLEVGIDAILIGEGGAGAQMLSPAMYEEFLLEPQRRMIEEIQGPTILHICGDITPRLGALSKLGLDVFNFDWAIEPKTMKRVAEGHFKIMGNVNTGDLLRGTPETIERQVIECLEAGVDFIAPGCAVSPLCPSVNFVAMRDAVERWSGGH
jgi:[methyl-Co(III) methanol-specific corrinoid protein]:coenzyme M methyltransferase